MDVPASEDFVGRIIEGFETIRQRQGYAVLAEQFFSGELSFIVDRQGIRIHLDQVEVEEPETVQAEDLDSW